MNDRRGLRVAALIVLGLSRIAMVLPRPRLRRSRGSRCEARPILGPDRRWFDVMCAASRAWSIIPSGLEQHTIFRRESDTDLLAPVDTNWWGRLDAKGLSHSVQSQEVIDNASGKAEVFHPGL